MSGKFVVVEGPDGGGKTSVITELKQYYPDAVFTREPGGTEFAEAIRRLLLSIDFFPGRAGIDAITEVLLFNAARRDHWVHTIKPALDAGKLVISDRWVDSTIVYQLSHHALETYKAERGAFSFANLFQLTNRWEQPMGLRILDAHRLAGLPTPDMTLYIAPDQLLREQQINNRDDTHFERKEDFQYFVQENYEKWIGIVTSIKTGFGDHFNPKIHAFIKNGDYAYIVNTFNRMDMTMEAVCRWINKTLSKTSTKAMKEEVSNGVA